MTALIERLEALTAPSREVDALIAVSIGKKATMELGDIALGNHRFVPVHFLSYTASIDAALTLAGDNWKPVLDVAMFWQWQKYHDASKLADLPRFICLSALHAKETSQ